MRYYYHVADATRREPDPQGVDFPSPDEARLAAVRYAGDIIRNDPEHLWSSPQLRVEVTNEQGSHCWTVLVVALDTPTSEQQMPNARLSI